MVEKLIENYNRRSGLKIAVGKEKIPKPLETLRILDLVPVTGLEPVRCRQRRILSPLRLPFHHTGQYDLTSIVHFSGKSKGKVARKHTIRIKLSWKFSGINRCCDYRFN